MIYPPAQYPLDTSVTGSKALGLVEDKLLSGPLDLDSAEKAVQVALNGRFGLVAVGTAK